MGDSPHVCKMWTCKRRTASTAWVSRFHHIALRGSVQQAPDNRQSNILFSAIMSSPITQAENNGSEESPAQKQARLRRERRAAKINAGGSARLEKITNLSGRPPPEPVAPSPPPGATANPSGTSDANDPEEVDISSHPYTPRSTNNGGPTEADIRQLLRSAPLGEQQQAQNPFAPHQEVHGGEEDPMMRMLQQMLGGAGGAPDQGGGDGGLPPALAAMLGAQGSGAQGQEQGVSREEEKKGRDIWKIIHAVMALALGIYIVWTTPFSGSQLARAGAAQGEEAIKNFFWVFATVELLSQSTRFFLEGAKTVPAGMMGMVLGMLPEPFKTYASLAVRYSGIFTQLIADAVTVVFVLGIVAWWRGEVE